MLFVTRGKPDDWGDEKLEQVACARKIELTAAEKAEIGKIQQDLKDREEVQEALQRLKDARYTTVALSRRLSLAAPQIHNRYLIMRRKHQFLRQ